MLIKSFYLSAGERFICPITDPVLPLFRKDKGGHHDKSPYGSEYRARKARAKQETGKRNSVTGDETGICVY